jgi:hypothetical protein
MIPALIGNIIGGVSLVGLINHAQLVAGTSEEARSEPQGQGRSSSAGQQKNRDGSNAKGTA